VLRHPDETHKGGEGNRTAVLLDRHPLWLDAVDNVLRRIRVTVVARTTSPARALALIEDLRPDLFVTDIETNPGEMDGVSCLAEAKRRHPDLKSIVLSTREDSEAIERALLAGALAYVVKTAHPDDFAAAVRQVFDHSIYLPGAGVDSARPAPKLEHVDGAPRLTRRELEILRLVAEGLSNAELAKMLWVTEQTVKFHLSNIYRKLDVANRTEASRWAQLHGLLPPGGRVVITAA
jgi:DNA-binding NarL/FixJ family response regulator